MSFKVTCPHCKAVVSAPDGSMGKTAKCPKCGKTVAIFPSILAADAPSDSAVSEESVPPLVEESTEVDSEKLESEEVKFTITTFVHVISVSLLLLSVWIYFDRDYFPIAPIHRSNFSVSIAIIASMAICTGLILSKLNQILNAIKDATNID